MRGRRSPALSLVSIALIAIAWLGLSFLVDNSYYRLLLTVIPIWATFAVSWNIFSGYSGLASFGHAAFFGLGAFTVVLSLIHFDLTPWFGLPLAGVVGALAGALIGYPTFRLRGLYFALAMLAYPICFIYLFNWLGYQEVTFPMKREHSLWYMQFGDYRGYLLLSLGLLVISVVLSIIIERSRFGRSLLAIKQNELAAEASGVDTFRWKMLALVLSGALAAIAGGLYGAVVLVITPSSMFGLVVSAQAIILTLFGGAGVVWGPLVGTVTLLTLTELLEAELGNALPGIQGIVYGGAIIAVTLLAPEGIYWRIKDLFVRYVRRVAPADSDRFDKGEASTSVAPPIAESSIPKAHRGHGGAILSVRSLSKAYGGLRAIDDVSFDVLEREVLGIIGPNGAGKTTLFNLLNGIVAPDSGEIRFAEQNIEGLKPNRVCRLGIGRTFQVARAFGRMSVLENVVIGAYVAADGERQAWEHALEAVATVGLADRADVIASRLTSKELRLMELARALASRPRLLLLDEPLAGLGNAETEELMATVARLPARGVTVVMIEHSIGAMMNFADRFVVLDHGSFLAEGTPKDVISQPDVVEAYLGYKWAKSHA